MNERETFAALVLHFAPGVGIAGARRLHEHFGSLVAALEHPDELPRVQGLTDEARASLADPSLRERAHREWDYDAAHRVRCLSFLDEAYPARMRKLPDAPLVLFYCGSAPLNRARVVSVVGTRRVTDYGQKLCSRFLSELSQLCPDVLVSADWRTAWTSAPTGRHWTTGWTPSGCWHTDSTASTPMPTAAMPGGWCAGAVC